MYFFLKQVGYNNLNVYRSFFQKKKDKPIYIRVDINELSVFTINRSIENPLIEQKTDVLNINFSSIDDVEQFLLNINTNGFRNIEDFKKSANHDKISNFSLIKYGKDFPNYEIFKSDDKYKYSYPIEFLFCLIEDVFDNLSELYRNNQEECVHYRNILQESKVFEYINKKRLFYKSLYQYKISNSKEIPYKHELKKCYGQYLNLLLQNEILNHIPRELFKHNQWFLQNPEKEIIHLAKLHKEFDIDDTSVSQIQDYLLKKHDIIEANALSKKLNLFFFQIIGSISFFCIIFNWLSLNDCNNNWLFILGTFFSVLSIIIPIIFPLLKKKNYNLNLIMLRFALSIVSVWVIFFTIDNLFQLFLNVDKVVFIFLLVLIPVSIIISILIEVNIHSPYHSKKDSKVFSRKTFPIFIYAFNLSFLCGIVFHILFVTKYIENNHLMESNLYVQSKIEFIENRLNSNSELIEMLNDFERSHILLNAYSLKKDSILNYHIKTSYNQKAQNINLYIDKFFKNKNSSDWIKSYEDILSVNDSTIKFHNMFIKNFNILQNRKIELLRLRQLFEKGEYLKEYVSNFSDKDSISDIWNITFPLYSAHYKDNTSDKFYKNQRVQIFNYGLYYKLFLLQVVLVMAFAIVGQAIISKDTITEPL